MLPAFIILFFCGGDCQTLPAADWSAAQGLLFVIIGLMPTILVIISLEKNHEHQPC